MDIDKLAYLLKSDDIQCAEIVTYHSTDNSLIRKTTTIDYFRDDDYQWSITSKPIVFR
jgi:hypothetical protein